MNKNQLTALLTNWIETKSKVLEQIICDAADNYLTIYGDKPNFVYDLKQCELESWNLSKGKDLCYDRPSVGLSYAMWYLGRRINTSLVFAIEHYVETLLNKKKEIEIFDLGAGTGAVQIAFGICQVAAFKLNLPIPKIRVINIDTSPFMLDYNRLFLWKCFQSRFQVQKIHVEYNVNSWMSKTDIQFINPIIVASYLFDHNENKKEIASYFQSIVEKYQPETLILLTSSQPQKRIFLNEVAKKISNQEYSITILRDELIYHGTMSLLDRWRTRFNKKYKIVFSGNKPTWNERSFYCKKLTRKAFKIGLGFGKKEKGFIKNIDLYLPPLKVRREIILNDQQKAAAKLTNRPTVITGPAGCGKSVVITERIKNLCEKTDYNTSLSILLTTFNKGLTLYLGNWLYNILDERKCRRLGNKFFFKNNDSPNIELLHFDILPTQIGHIRGNLYFDTDHRLLIKNAVKQICEELNIEPSAYEGILSPNFLYDEYIRVIYGQQYDSFQEYLKGERKGRPFNLGRREHNKFKRELIWKVIRRYLGNLKEQDKESIFTRRHKLLKQLQSGLHRSKYTHIFVDEFQDCTQADYQIFYGLLKDNSQLVLAGDFAQAVHLGNSASVPREDKIFQGKRRMRNFDYKKLEGSFRLPFRVSECIKPLSEYIKVGKERTDIITPYKGSPPGARPIMVFGKNTNDLTGKIAWIVWYYNKFQIVDLNKPNGKKITILEKDTELSKSINAKWKEGIAVTETILKLKGLEKECIIWSTRKIIGREDEIHHFAYTILTRTSSILIIAVTPETPKYVWKILSLFDNDKLILWDKETLNIYNNNVEVLNVEQN